MMPPIGARIVVYGFVGAFALGSLVLLTIAIGSTMQRAVLIFSGSRADGIVVAARQVGRMKGGAAAYAPVLQFNATDGRTYVVTSDVSGPASAGSLPDRSSRWCPRRRLRSTVDLAARYRCRWRRVFDRTSVRRRDLAP